jgi:hypothetical protein
MYAVNMQSSHSRSQQFALFENETAGSIEETAISQSSGRFSNFVVYVDESGDHGMQTLDANYPVFALSFCVFYQRHYSEHVVPDLPPTIRTT